MKITYNTSTKTQTTDKNDRWIQKTSNNYVYLYGVASGWLVKATFTRRDGMIIANIGGVYDTDPDGTYCYVIQVPTQAAELDKQISLSILIYEPSGDDYIIHGTIDTAGYFYPNSGVIVPEDLNTEQYNALNVAISNLATNKHEHSAIVGTDSETVGKDTQVYSKNKADEVFETILDANAHKNNTENPHSVTKAQVGLGNVDNTADTDKPVSSAQQASLNLKANLAGGNTFSGQQNITGPVNITNTINANGNKINFVGNPVDGGDAVNKNTLDSELTNHDDSESSHEPIRLLIQELDREISRLDGRGVSYGEVPYTTAELQAMDSTALLNTIIAAVEAKSWFEGTYTPSNGDLVYDEGVGDGVNYHEWEYNQDAGAWADNGAISSPKATNDIFGTVKGNSYVSIVAGLMQILLADNATYLKDESSSNKYTYQQIYDAIADRYTKDEVNAIKDDIYLAIESLKAVYGWEDSVLVNVSDRDSAYQIPESQINDYDLVLISVTFNDTDETTRSMLLPPAEWLNGDHKIVFNNNTGLDGYIIVQKLLPISLGVYFQTQGSLTLTSYDLKVTGIKMTPLDANDITYSNSEMTATNVEEALDEHEREIEEVKYAPLVDKTYTEKLESTYGDFTPESDGKPLLDKVYGRTIPALENLVVNGDFSDGTTEWSASEATGFVVNNGIAEYISTAQTGRIIKPPLNISAGQVILRIAKIKATSNQVYLADGGSPLTAHSGSGNFEILKHTRIETVNNRYVNPLDIRTSGWDKIFIDYVMAFNLTASHGVTETTGTAYDNAVADIEAQLEANGGYIDDTPTTHVENTEIKSVGKNLFDKGQYTTDYAYKIKVKPSTAYVWSVSTAYKTYDINEVELVSATGTTVTTGSSAYYIAFSGISNVDTFQLEQGTVATPYAPYTSETQKFNHGRLSKLPNGVADKIRYDNGAYVLDRYVQEYTLVSGDITSIDDSLSNTTIARTNTNFNIDLGSVAWLNEPNGVIRVDGKTHISTSNIGLIEQIGNYATVTNGRLIFVFTKGTTLEQAQAALAGTKIWYQLETPLLANEVIDVDGTLIQESVTTVEQLQNIPTEYDIKFTVNVKATTVEQISLIEDLDTRVTATEGDIVTLEAVVSSHAIVVMTETAWATYTREADKVYGVYNETTGVITWYFGTVGVE